jgi:hypothetical protein
MAFPVGMVILGGLLKFGGAVEAGKTGITWYNHGYNNHNPNQLGL